VTDDHRGRNQAISHELADRLHVSHRTVLGWERDGHSLAAILDALLKDGSLQESGWISVASTAARFEVDEKTVRRWISSGRVTARRFGPKLIRVWLPSVLKFSGRVGLLDLHD
jgi:transcriptional regulator with XRE-family HTH domain